MVLIGKLGRNSSLALNKASSNYANEDDKKPPKGGLTSGP